jgi:HAMP domain-containing protein
MPINFREHLGTLRVRLLAASALALLGLTGVVGVTLHQVFEHQARESLRARTKLLALGAGAFAAQAFAPPGSEPGAVPPAGRLQEWLEADEDFVAARFIAADGNVAHAIARGPVAGRASSFTTARVSPLPGEANIVERTREIAAYVPLVEHRDGWIGVEVVTSTKRLEREIQNFRWLFGSIFLLAGAVFAALALYLTRGVVLPLEEVRRAAHRIVSGELNVRIPVSGDREIDDIARFLHSLADRRNGGSVSQPPASTSEPRSQPLQPPA